MNLYEKISEIESFIAKNLICPPNIKNIPGHEDVFYPHITLSLLTAIGDENGGRSILYVGPPGTGKTCIAEYVASIVYAVPLSIIRQVELKGSPDLTIYNMMGTLNIAKLNKEGINEIIWNPRMLLVNYFLILDELLRAPPNVQNSILHIIDKECTVHELLGDHLELKNKGSVFATGNPKDGGCFEMSSALLDRFDIGIPQESPPVVPIELLNRQKEYSNELNDRETIRRYTKVFEDFSYSNRGLDSILEEVDSLRNLYSEKMNEKGIPTLSPRELEKLKKDISIYTSNTTYSFVNNIIEVLPCIINVPTSNDGNSIINKVEYPIVSARAIYALFWIMSSISWYFNKVRDRYVEEIDIFTLTLPWVLYHRSFGKISCDNNRYKRGWSHREEYELVLKITQYVIQRGKKLYELAANRGLLHLRNPLIALLDTLCKEGSDIPEIACFKQYYT